VGSDFFVLVLQMVTPKDVMVACLLVGALGVLYAGFHHAAEHWM
jgi:hypothetical protein